MKDIEYQIKKIYQYQFSDILSIDFPSKTTQEIIREIVQESKNEYDGFDRTEDQFLKVNITETKKELSELLDLCVNTQKKESHINSVHIVSKGDILDLKTGSYELRHPSLLDIGVNNRELQKSLNIDEDFLIFMTVCSLKNINALGKKGLVVSMLQAGELNYVVKSYLHKLPLEVVDLNLNNNQLAHIAGLNINKVLIMNALIFVRKDENAVFGI